jgi:hypothetical protein
MTVAHEQVVVEYVDRRGTPGRSHG